MTLAGRPRPSLAAGSHSLLTSSAPLQVKANLGKALPGNKQGTDNTQFGDQGYLGQDSLGAAGVNTHGHGTTSTHGSTAAGRLFGADLKAASFLICTQSTARSFGRQQRLTRRMTTASAPVQLCRSSQATQATPRGAPELPLEPAQG